MNAHPIDRKGVVVSEAGQALVLMAVFITVLLGMAAFVIDVGSWFRAHRAAQATADAAALAGAQALPDDPGQASALANEYATKNGGGVVTLAFKSEVLANDTITVKISRPAPGFFVKVFGIESVQVSAPASARAGIPSAARYAAPIAVDEQHPMLQCRCFGDPTQIVLIHLHEPGSGNAAGAFGLVNLESQHISGNVGAETLAEWILHGYDGSMPLGKYRSSPSAEFNSSHIKNALDARIGTELLLPVFRSITGQGSGAEYDVIAWVGFVPTSFTAAGSKGTIKGYFTQINWQGLPDETGTAPDYGVRVVSFVE